MTESYFYLLISFIIGVVGAIFFLKFITRNVTLRLPDFLLVKMAYVKSGAPQKTQGPSSSRNFLAEWETKYWEWGIKTRISHLFSHFIFHVHMRDETKNMLKLRVGSLLSGWERKKSFLIMKEALPISRKLFMKIIAKISLRRASNMFSQMTNVNVGKLHLK